MGCLSGFPLPHSGSRQLNRVSALYRMHCTAAYPLRSIQRSLIWSKQCRASRIPHIRPCYRSKQQQHTVCFLPDQQEGSASHSGVMSKGAAVKETGTLSVLTLNIWGLWLVSKRRAERVRHLSDYLTTCKEDIVLLQEVWIDADAQLLIASGRAAGLVHATHFRSGIFGSGLVTLSRYPIIRHQFWRYAAGGFATAISCGDYYAGKGVGWVRLATPLGEADVFNTHIHANYCHDYRLPPPDLRRAAAAATAQLAKGNSGTAASKAAAEAMLRGSGAPDWAGSRIPDDDDSGVRVCQLLELSEIIDIITNSSSSSSSDQRLVILGGDLNCKPHMFEIDLLRLRLPHLSDAWAAATVRSSDGSTSSNADVSSSSSSSSESLLGGNPEGYTCHAPGNTFQPRRQVPERIDYVWSNMVTQRAEVTLQLCPNSSSSSSKKLLSYSDHFAVRAILAKPGSTAAAAGAACKGGSPDKAMKLGSSRSSSGGGGSPMAGVAQQQQQQYVRGEGANMELAKRVATAYAAMLLLDEGYTAFVNNGRAMLALGGFVIASLLYVGVGMPMIWPGLTLTGFPFTAAVLVAAAVAVLGLVLLLMGFVGDKSQQRAIQSGLRLLRVWMEQQGLATLPQRPQDLVQQQQQQQ